MFTSTDCQFTGSYTSCQYLAPGTTMFAGILLLEPDGQILSGYGQTTTLPNDLLRRESIEGGFLRPFKTTMGSDRRLRFSVTNGASPTFVYELSWDVQLMSDTRMEGTLSMRHRWYKVAGDFGASGPVTLTKR